MVEAEKKKSTEHQFKEEEPRIGVYACHCGSNIASVLPPAEVAKYAEGLPGVVVANDHHYMCSEPGQRMIQEDIEKHNLNRVVVAACTVAMHEPTFRSCISDVGLNPFMFEMANIREHDSW
ncbi:MAG: disulfide reductase, partial [Anaerolineae bacterium]|nr:disulfide reductase [Anaerolineae bacterium]